jgi:16S rRNA (guanine527-N7)-methyltransferase
VRNHEALKNVLHAGLGQHGVALPVAAEQRLLDLVQLMEKWNKVYNLTAVRDPEEMITRHLLDSLAVLPHVRGQHVLDIGCGAGLPGLPLAIALPGTRFTLLDANAKKTRFVTQAAVELGLANVEVVQTRVEKYRPVRKFDTLMARAVASVAELLRNAQHLCASNGEFLFMKGAYPAQELAEMPGEFKMVEVIKLQVPGLDAERHLVRVHCATAQESV